MSKYKSELVLVAVAAIWGTGYIATVVGLEQFGPLQLLAIRFLSAAGIMSAIFMRRLRRANRTVIKYGLILGVVLFLGFILQTVGLVFTTPAKSGFIVASSVAIVPFIGTAVYRRKPDIYSVLGAFSALVGIAFLSLKIDAPMNLGDLLTMLGTVFFAFHIFFTSEFMARGADEGCVVVLQIAFTGVAAAIAAVITGQTDFSSVGVTGILALMYMAVFTTSVCFFAQTWAMKSVPETRAAIILSTECLFGGLFSICLGYEPLTLRMFIGGVFIVCGVLITEVRPRFS